MDVDNIPTKRILAEVYEKHRWLMFTVAHDILHDHQLAEDAVHNAFIKLLKQESVCCDVNSAKTKRFLIVITKNEAITIWRKRKKKLDAEVPFDELEYKGVFTLDDNPEGQNEIASAFYELPDIYKDVFLLKYSVQLNNTEIAAALGISEPAIRKRLERGRDLLQAALQLKREK